MRGLPLFGSTWLLGACSNNTIILESNDDTTTGEPGDGSTMGGPLSTTTTTGPSMTGPSMTGPPSTVTTDALPILDFPSMKLDFGSTDTDGFECDPPRDAGTSATVHLRPATSTHSPCSVMISRAREIECASSIAAPVRSAPTT